MIRALFLPYILCPFNVSFCPAMLLSKIKIENLSSMIFRIFSTDSILILFCFFSKHICQFHVLCVVVVYRLKPLSSIEIITTFQTNRNKFYKHTFEVFSWKIRKIPSDLLRNSTHYRAIFHLILIPISASIFLLYLKQEIIENSRNGIA